MTTKSLTPAELAAKTNAVIDRWLAMGRAECYRSGVRVKPVPTNEWPQKGDAAINSGIARGWVQESIIRGEQYITD